MIRSFLKSRGTLAARVNAFSPLSRSSVSRRWSANSFKGGRVENETFQLKSNYALWRPSDRFMKYSFVRYIYDNIFVIATYQLALEFGLSAIFGFLIYFEVCTGESVKQWLEDHYYPFASWVELENVEFKEPIQVGPFALKPAKLTAAYTGHNIASGLLPVQIVVLICSFPAVLKGYHAFLRHMGKPVPKPTPAPASLKQAKATENVQEAAATTKDSAKGYQRKPSYVRPSSTRR